MTTNSSVTPLAAGQVRRDSTGGTVTIIWVDYVRRQVAVTYHYGGEVHTYSVGTIEMTYPTVVVSTALRGEGFASYRRQLADAARRIGR